MNTADKVLIMVAWIEGKKIQIRYPMSAKPDNWYDMKTEPSWNWENLDYRIKP